MNTKAVADYISNWLKEYAQSAYSKGFVVGVSGGIDSAVTSTLAARSGLPTLVLEMPIHQASDQVTRAQEHIAWLKEHYPNVADERVDLTSTFDTFCSSLPPTTSEKKELSLANTRARLRMTTLYYFAGIYDYLVVGTGNKVEDFGVGFFTKYGDGGVDISPIADLLKSEVYAMGKYLGIVESIQKARPTDGLWADNRSDEDQIGASYDELEWAMENYGKISADYLTEREKEVMRIYEKYHTATQHKITPIPVCKIPKELKLTKTEVPTMQ